MRINLILLSSALVFFGCARQSSLTAELVPRSLTAINLEETLSGRDEVMIAYSLTSYDAQNKPVAVVNGGWGVEPIKKGQQLDLQTVGLRSAGPRSVDSQQTERSPTERSPTERSPTERSPTERSPTERSPTEHSLAKSIQLALPKNGKIVASLVLIEVDDYNQAKQTIAKIQKIHNVVSVPVGLLLTATDVLTPLKYVSAGLVASGIGLQLLDKLDADDILGQSSVELHESALRQRKQRFVRVPATFSGQQMRDSFEYQLTYDVVLKTVKIQSVRQ